MQWNFATWFRITVSRPNTYSKWIDLVFCSYFDSKRSLSFFFISFLFIWTLNFWTVTFSRSSEINEQWGKQNKCYNKFVFISIYNITEIYIFIPINMKSHVLTNINKSISFLNYNNKTICYLGRFLESVKSDLYECLKSAT